MSESALSDVRVIELAADTATPDMQRRLDEVKWAMLDEWAQTRRAPRHARWLHERSAPERG